jgi:hypothetical protein
MNNINYCFRLLTLVDITPTGVTRSTELNCLLRNQQRNFETVIQVLSLRSQPHIDKWPFVYQMDKRLVKNLFSDLYASKNQTVWAMYFTTEHPLAYNTSAGELQGLLCDFEQVPVITGLTETAKFMLPIFYPAGSIKNINITKLTSC